MNEKYHKKYIHLKKRVKDLIFENAALCDQVSEIQQNVANANSERKFLLQRLLAHEPDYTLHDTLTDKKIPLRKKSQTQDRHKYATSKLADRPTPQTTTTTTAKNGRPTIGGGSRPVLEPYTRAKIKIEAPTAMPVTPEPSTPPAEIKIEPYPTDFEAACNSYEIDNLVIQSLGEIDSEKPNFHNEHLIYPIGFTTIRIFGSMANPWLKSVYTCRITEIAGNPRFEMSSEADSEVMIVGPSPQFCLTTLLNYMRDTHGLDMLSTVEADGNWFFGLTHPVVMSLIEGMPNFGACSRFRGFNKLANDAAIQRKENDPGINYESFLQLVGQSGLVDDMYQEDVHEEIVDHQ